jgi:hypothetical protein
MARPVPRLTQPGRHVAPAVAVVPRRSTPFRVSRATAKRARPRRAFLNGMLPAQPPLRRLTSRLPQRRSSRARRVRRTSREARQIAPDWEARQCSHSSHAPSRCRGRIGGPRSATAPPDEGTPEPALRANWKHVAVHHHGVATVGELHRRRQDRPAEHLVSGVTIQAATTRSIRSQRTE